MSLQTNEQALGYILLAGFGAGFKADDLADLKRQAMKLFDVARKDTETGEIGNFEVAQILEESAKYLRLNDVYGDGIFKSLKGEIYYCFDMKTVEEAGNIFHYFRKLGV